MENIPLYDVDMVVDKEHIPPEDAPLSSDLAYKVIRLVIETGTMLLRALSEFWPGNFTTVGTPVTVIEPMGKLALVKNKDGFIYARAYGFKKMTGKVTLEVL
ncbi:hypothetical protein SLS56_005923 [Neofusicoccum ribis]|uniref:Uncharacterized protein n=1 Tax=Neofusicoccum ribis TaxID=45134 RepID=A0ABR3SSB1_9PEZI